MTRVVITGRRIKMSVILIAGLIALVAWNYRFFRAVYPLYSGGFLVWPPGAP